MQRATYLTNRYKPIGSLHGEMHKLVRNPFRTKFMRQNFDAAIQTYDAKHRNFITPDGARCTGNAWANDFWRGFDNVPIIFTGSKDTAGYAMYRAGQAVRKACDNA